MAGSFWLPLLGLLCTIDGTVSALTFSDVYKNNFDEELFLKPLPTGHVYAYFQFTTKWDTGNATELSHFHLFPRAVGEIIEHMSVQELHLTLTQGRWRHRQWGYPFQDAPPGAQLWAYFRNSTRDVDEAWLELATTLSGLICASLNFIDSSVSVSPNLSFRPWGITNPSSETQLRYAALPRENVCTENLTPWKRLLPCQTQRGLATLLNARHIYVTDYHSLGLHVRPVCKHKDCKESALELVQTVSLVFDIPAASNGNKDWSLRRLFGSHLFSSCPLADHSNIYVMTRSDQDVKEINLSPKPSETVVSVRGGSQNEYALYDIANMTRNGPLNVVVSHQKSTMVYGIIPPPVLYASSYLTGSGLGRGHLVTRLHNTYSSRSLKIVLMQVVPWFLRVYLHSVQIVSKGKKITPDQLIFQPSRDRERPLQLELVITLPPSAVTEVSFVFERGFLKWLEYPPDANHGFYIPSAIVSAYLPGARNYTAVPQDVHTIFQSFNQSRGNFFVRISTETVLVSLPTPDFSMPYNVICLACTVVALAFGPLHNITTKRLVLKDPTQSTNFPERVIRTVKEKVGALFGRKATAVKEEKKD